MDRPTWNGSNRSGGRSVAGPKNLRRIDQEVPSFSLVRGPSFSLTGPPGICVMYGAVPTPLHTLQKRTADAARVGCAVRGGGRPWGSSRERVAWLDLPGLRD